MRKYRKKPVVIEAVQLKRNFAELAIAEIPKELFGNYNIGEFAEDSCYLEIKTLEGVMTASEGDYIIKGINGEFYPCKPDIFEATYEAVESV